MGFEPVVQSHGQGKEVSDRHSFTMRDYLAWLLETHARDKDLATKGFLEDFFLRGMLWGSDKLWPDQAFYQWLDLKKEKPHD